MIIAVLLGGFLVSGCQTTQETKDNIGSADYAPGEQFLALEFCTKQGADRAIAAAQANQETAAVEFPKIYEDKECFEAGMPVLVMVHKVYRSFTDYTGAVVDAYSVGDSKGTPPSEPILVFIERGSGVSISEPEQPAGPII